MLPQVGRCRVHRAVVGKMEFPYRDHARVLVKVGTLGREPAGASPLAATADLHDVVLEMQLEEGRWKVKRAAW